MSKKSRQVEERPRVPLADVATGLQVNACRQPQCANFGIAPAHKTNRGKAKKGQPRFGDRYKKVGGTEGAPAIQCHGCQSTVDLKSNFGIVEEMRRIKAYLEPLPPYGCSTVSARTIGPILFHSRRRSKTS